MGSDFNRRDLIKRAVAVGLVAAPAAGFLSACASGGGDNESSAKGKKTKDNPFAVANGAGLDVVIFKGGYGDDYARAFEKLYEKKYKGKTSHLGTQDITGKLQPRFNTGSPPDVIDDSGAKQIKLDVLHKNGQLADLTPLLDAPYIDDPSKKVRDVLQPGTIETGSFDGKMYSLSYVYTVWGLWYSGKLFKDKGYTPPKTWSDFMALCKEIKKDGTAPFCHQGKYPYYINILVMDLIAKTGGLEYVKRIDSLDPTVWGEGAAKSSIEAVYELVDKGYLLPGTNGMTHIESQTAWNEYKAAFIPSGSWLENEQLKSTPQDFDMKFLPVPTLDGAKLPFEAIRAGAGEPFIVPEKAKNKAGGLEFLRIMLSKEASGKFAQAANSLTVLKDGVGSDVKLRPGTQSTVEVLKAAGTNTFNYNYPNTASEFDTAVQNASGELMAKRIKPAEWLKRVKAAAEKAKKG
ncbi:N-acetylglucosamine/diacetylchitobiose ABC transporter substrate-binding protein [Wenjunlia tyrosinilytica]|uniref:Carbohydrate ABC transporter, N-acetylglucosamine/diacetylchitobiose-binding protein n=1 Tax=Wenjunlia tyrosinilytica TaxID=1544741 RepID=A0A917ZS77_9ACTN|nr:N-acetylglucosamine/diacetylchitobiose ABC transporter substrate-binding protein [Wenjunlia tyrosinilytica]GGO91112.1 carbohydrate ABC transporter, N-acetylglucosamine/diacetylchitobiose-binding protein [Wenjunlia tyrosinilytica]